MYICVYIYKYEYTYININMNICIYIYVFVYVYIYIYTCTYIYTHIHFLYMLLNSGYIFAIVPSWALAIDREVLGWLSYSDHAYCPRCITHLAFNRQSI